MVNNKKRKGGKPSAATAAPASTPAAQPPAVQQRRPKPKQTEKHSPEQLYEQAQQALQYDDFDKARECLRRATAAAPRNAELAGAYGALLAELGIVPEAIVALRKAIELSPLAGWDKYMYLAQALSDEDAVEAERLLRQGVALLREDAAAATAAVAASAKYGDSGAAAESQALQVRLCSALCSLAEQQLHIADEPLSDAVAESVAAMLQEAQVADPRSPEPGQALASLRSEQGRPDEALAALRQSMAHWFRLEENDDEEPGTAGRDAEAGGTEDSGRGTGAAAAAAAAGPTAMDTDAAGGGVRGDGGRPHGNRGGGGSASGSRRRGGGQDVAMGGEEEDEEDRVDDAVSSDEDDDSQGGSSDEDDGEGEEGPSLEFRFECAKLLLELDETSVVAVQVLEELVAEDDSNPEVWHLLGLAYYSGHQFEEAQEAADNAGLLITKLGISADAEIVNSLEELRFCIREGPRMQEQLQ